MLIGIVGNIAAGKSTIISELKNKGVETIKYDDIAKQVMRELWEPVSNNKLSELIDIPNCMFSDNNQTINDIEFGNVLFNDYKLLRMIDNILSPISISRIKTVTEEVQRDGHHVALESALLIEHGLHKFVDKVILVVADNGIRKARLMKRNNLSEKQAMIRMLAQSSQEYKLEFSDYVINNSLSIEKTRRQTYVILKHLHIGDETP